MAANECKECNVEEVCVCVDQLGSAWLLGQESQKFRYQGLVVRLDMFEKLKPSNMGIHLVHSRLAWLTKVYTAPQVAPCGYGFFFGRGTCSHGTPDPCH